MTTTQVAILYSFRRCPYAMRARMALSLTHCQVELREIILKNKPASMLAFSPKGTVPILVLPNGNIIDESLDIIDWAISQNRDVILPPTTAQKVLIERNDSEFKADLDRYKYFDRYPEHDQQYYRQQGEEFLSTLEHVLTQQRAIIETDDISHQTPDFAREQLSNEAPFSHDVFLYGDRAGYADIAIFPFVRQFSHVDKIWFEQANYPNLRHWLNSFLTGENFLAVMTKFNQWQEGQTPMIFPA